jgi:hypothetical protein
LFAVHGLRPRATRERFTVTCEKSIDGPKKLAARATISFRSHT